MSSSIWVEFRIHGNICITEKSPYSPKLFFCFLFFIIYFLAVLLSFCPFYSTLEMTLVDFFYLILESTANWSARKDFLGQEEDIVHGTLPPPLNVWLQSGSISRFRLGEFFPGSCDCRLEIAEWSKGEGGKKQEMKIGHQENRNRPDCSSFDPSFNFSPWSLAKNLNYN